jgi:hypothetical protein
MTTATEEDLVLIRQPDRWLEELDLQLQLPKAITASGAGMTLPAATVDLKDCSSCASGASATRAPRDHPCRRPESR